VSEESTSFACYLPPIQSAIKWHGSGDSVRFQLEVPREELAGFLPMLEWTDGMLEVTVKPKPRKAEVKPVDDDYDWV